MREEGGNEAMRMIILQLEMCSFIEFFAPPPLSFVYHLPLNVEKRSLSVEVAAAKFALIPLSACKMKRSPSVALETICIAYVDVSISMGDLGLADQLSVHPISFKLLAVGEDKQPATAELANSHVLHFFDHRHTALLCLHHFEHFTVLNAVVVLLLLGGTASCCLFESGCRVCSF